MLAAVKGPPLGSPRVSEVLSLDRRLWSEVKTGTLFGCASSSEVCVTVTSELCTVAWLYSEQWSGGVLSVLCG